MLFAVTAALVMPFGTAGCATDDAADERLAALVDDLQHAQGPDSDRLFAMAIDVVATGGDVPGGLARRRGQQTRGHVDQLVSLATDVSSESSANLCAAFNFTRSLIRSGAADLIYAAGLEHIRERLARASGTGLGGEAISIGGLVGLVTAADDAAGSVEDRTGARRAFVRGLALIGESVGSSNAELDRLIDDLAAGSVENTDDEEGAYAPAAVRFQSGPEILNALAVHEYRIRETWTSGEIIEAARDEVANPTDADVDFFVDRTTGDRRPIKPVADMSSAEVKAYNAWLTSGQVVNKVGRDSTAADQSMQQVADDAESCD